MHGITTTERYNKRYNINTNWGQRELLAFLDLFLSLCIPIKKIAESCLEVSIEIANKYLPKESDEKIPTNGSDELLYLFINCFKLKKK